MTPLTEEARRLSADLASELGQAPTATSQRSWVVPSRTRQGHDHHVALAMDGEYICNCEAASLGKRECWAIKYVREEIVMSTETDERMLPAVQMAPPQSLLPTERTYALIDRAANLALSGMVSLPKELNSREKVAAVMLYGWELGLQPMTAIQELYIVNGRVQPSARVMAGLLRARTDATIKVVESTDTKCTLRLIWPSRRIDESWTVEWAEIVRAKLANKEVWASYPRDKLIAHCTKRLLRIYAPDIINGLVGPAMSPSALVVAEEEIDDEELYNPGEGHVIAGGTGEIIEAASEKQPTTTEPQRAAIADWQEAVKQKDVKQLSQVVSWAKARYPYAVEDNRLKTLRLYDVDASDYVAALKTMHETGSLPIDGATQEVRAGASGASEASTTSASRPEDFSGIPPATPPDHECEATLDPETDRFQCEHCSRDMTDEIDADTPLQQAGLPT